MFQKFDSLISLMQAFSTEEKCVEHFRDIRWPDGAVCPHCGSCEPYELSGIGKFKCAEPECALKFSVRHGTIFEDSRLPLQKWFMAIYLITNHTKGISSVQLGKDIGVQQKTAWFMLHRIRAAIAPEDDQEQLTGIVEVDETYIGGKERFKHARKKVKGSQGSGSAKSKIVVLGMIQREGELRFDIIKSGTTDEIKPVVLKNLSPECELQTDEGSQYNWAKKHYRHGIVKHGVGEYVNDGDYTNTIEGVFGHFKRTITGVHHKMTRKHIRRYLSMFAWRWNNRAETGGKKVLSLLQSTIGRHLTYQELVRS